MWDDSAPSTNSVELPQVVVHEVEDADTSTNPSTEECKLGPTSLFVLLARYFQINFNRKIRRNTIQ